MVDKWAALMAAAKDVPKVVKRVGSSAVEKVEMTAAHWVLNWAAHSAVWRVFAKAVKRVVRRAAGKDD
jgi:hypothetical protein